MYLLEFEVFGSNICSGSRFATDEPGAVILSDGILR